MNDSSQKKEECLNPISAAKTAEMYPDIIPLEVLVRVASPSRDLDSLGEC